MANPPRTIDEYIATAAPKARPLLKRIRQTVRRAVTFRANKARSGKPSR